MAEKVCNVFISHIYEDDHRLPELKRLLDENGCQARDSSVNSATPNEAHNENYIKYSILAPRIDWAGTVVVLLTPDTKDSNWVQWEIDYARRQGKRIVGVWDHGEKDCEPPAGLDDFANAMVPWRADQIIAAIFGEINDWRDKNGKRRDPRGAVPRYNCG